MTPKELADTLNELAWSLRETGHKDWVVPARIATRIQGRIHGIKHLDNDSRPLINLCASGVGLLEEARKNYPDLPFWAKAFDNYVTGCQSVRK